MHQIIPFILSNRIAERKLLSKYKQSLPFPHVVLDDFLPVSIADQLYNDFLNHHTDHWIHYVHYNENKRGLNNRKEIPESINDFIDAMNSPETLQCLSDLSGIKNLLSDDNLEGGGMHVCERGGFLNIHADFRAHPHRRKWERRLNAILFLNKDWKKEYGGALELWSADMCQCVQSIDPIFNRLVIFNTTEHSYHGFPEPILCPPEMQRKSIALYYYTIGEKIKGVTSTDYQARPSDGYKAFFIWADKKILAIYSFIKSKLGLDDRFVSNILKRLKR